MVDLVNLGTPQVANRAFVLGYPCGMALAVEAGIENTIQSLVGLALDKISLLAALKEALQTDNPALANALNLQTLDAILAYISTKSDPAILNANELPPLLDQAGPASVTAARDGGVSSQINITYAEPPAGYSAEIYLDGVFIKHSTATAISGFVNDFISGVAAGSHTIRVLYRDENGAITRFGQMVEVA